MIPYGKQVISSQDIDSVVSVLKSDFLTQGPVVPHFEKAFAKKVQAEFAVAVNSATSALHIACLALCVSKGDRVWTSPISFVASSNCAVYCEAIVDFVDIDPKTYNMSVEALEQKLQEAELNGTLPKVVIPVHLAGQSCDMKAIHALSLKFGFKILEDASHATGAIYDGDPVGSCKYSDIAVFSFHPVKIITSGEGGMAVTNKHEIMLKLTSLRSHGITRDPNLMTIKPDGPWFYQQLELGFNYRMTDIHAALGNSQLERLDEFVSRRHAIAKTYYEELNIEGVTLPFQDTKGRSSFHLFILNFTKTTGPLSRNKVFNRLRDSGVSVNLHYIPIYRHPYYKNLSLCMEDFVQAETYYKSAISIPIYPSMTEEEQEFVIKVIKSDTVQKFVEPQGYQDLF
ncbi:UDP-4-amino-4,6-dideoxy-N-acetyl-beta-L-altrosamine transaminase [Paracoccaceae bacterium]|nr:UDP-4-amino-4,6-dideoxy-N-acetyl-beta-L-altrosamine transaminase [Paracoccaceae bacterium]